MEEKIMSDYNNCKERKITITIWLSQYNNSGAKGNE